MSGELSERKKQILKAIVDAHIEGGEPVGSKYILEHNDLNCSSATVRNEMAELEEMGFLEQPHTSAGRVPSELGYRFYVDTLLERYAMTASEISDINTKLRYKMNELDQILVAASKLASNMTNYTGIAIKPKAVTSIVRFETMVVDPRHFILVMLTSSEAVKIKHVFTDYDVSQESVSKLANALNYGVSRLNVDDITLPIIMKLEAAMGDEARLVGPVMKSIYEVMREIDGGELKLSGLDRLLQYPEYSDQKKLGELIGTLEQKEDILNLVSQNTVDDINVLIGSESSVKVMDQSAIVFKPIKKDGRTVGAIGIIGPRRMDYGKVLATIDGLTDSIAEIIEEPKMLNGGTESGNGDKQ